ncbi:MAG: flagellar hook assembly protein FlgD [Myxococcales bacterium]|nr:flagellar hook assembly protein FlgD [Myxococcales bacterium]
MDVSSVQSQTAQGLFTGPNQNLGKNEFLKLLTAQLRTQDPLNPMDDTAFVAQLAQFSSLEQLIDLNTGLGSISQSQDRVAATQATSLIGKEVLAIGDRFELKAGEPVDLSFYLGGDAKEVTVEIVDDEGNRRETVLLADKIAGKNTFEFDGRDSDGNALPPGNYSFNVSAKDSDDAAVNVTTTTRGRVTGIEFHSGVIQLQVGADTVTLSDLLEVTEG